MPAHSTLRSPARLSSCLIRHSGESRPVARGKAPKNVSRGRQPKYEAERSCTVPSEERNLRNEDCETLTRRSMLVGSCAFAGLLVVGCSSERADEAEQPIAREKTAAGSRPTMILHKDPNCGCCQSWADIAQNAGFPVQVVNEADMTAVKARLGVPQQLASCHTTEVAGLTVEGHVPIDVVEGMLRERPQGLRGIAVPGMPAGSPGMEMPDGRTEPFQVIAFFEDGRTSVYASSAPSNEPA